MASVVAIYPTPLALIGPLLTVEAESVAEPFAEKNTLIGCSAKWISAQEEKQKKGNPQEPATVLSMIDIRNLPDYKWLYQRYVEKLFHHNGLYISTPGFLLVVWECYFLHAAAKRGTRHRQVEATAVPHRHFYFGVVLIMTWNWDCWGSKCHWLKNFARISGKLHFRDLINLSQTCEKQLLSRH